MKNLFLAFLVLASGLTHADDRPIRVNAGEDVEVVLMNPIEGTISSTSAYPALFKVTGNGKLNGCLIASQIRFKPEIGRFSAEGKTLTCDQNGQLYPISGQAFFRNAPGIPAQVLYLDKKTSKPNGGETMSGIKVSFRLSAPLDVIRKGGM